MSKIKKSQNLEAGDNTSEDVNVDDLDICDGKCLIRILKNVELIKKDCRCPMKSVKIIR